MRAWHALLAPLWDRCPDVVLDESLRADRDRPVRRRCVGGPDGFGKWGLHRFHQPAQVFFYLAHRFRSLFEEGFGL